MDQTVNSSTTAKLSSWGKAIGHFWSGLYFVCTSFSARELIFHKKCYLAIPYYGCWIYVVVLLIMLIASAAIANGIRKKRPMEILPWLILTPLVVVVSAVLLYIIREQGIFLIAIILVCSIVLWYPIFKLYREMTANKDSDNDNVATAIYPPGGGDPYSAAAASEEQALATPGSQPPSYSTIAKPTVSYPKQVYITCPTAAANAPYAENPTFPVAGNAPYAAAPLYPSLANASHGLGLTAMYPLQNITAAADEPSTSAAAREAHNIFQGIEGATHAEMSGNEAPRTTTCKIETDSQEKEKNKPKDH